MLDFNAHTDALRNVLEDRNSLKKALFKTYGEQRLTREDRDDVKNTISVILRHFFKLTYEANNLLPSFSERDFEHYLALICLAKIRYMKERKENVAPRLEKSFSDHLLITDVKSFENVLFEAVKTPFSIPEDIKRYPSVYLSLTLDVPDFLITRIYDEYERDTALKIVKSLHDSPDTFFVGNNYGEPLEDTYSYDGELGLYRIERFTDLKGKDDFKQGKLILAKPVEKEAFDACNLNSLEESILLINQRMPDFASFIDSKLHEKEMVKIDSNYPKDENYRRAVEYDERRGMKRINNILSPLNLVKTFVEFDSYDAVFVNGEDLQIGRSGMRKEVLPCLREKDFKVSFTRELGALKESSYFVKPDGLLVLINSALTAEETTNVSKAFLEANKRFVLVEEKTILPFEHKSEGGYYSIFRRMQ